MLVAKHAAADDLRLSWHAPPGCPSAERVRDAALRSTGKEAREPLEAEARVERGDRWRVTIRSTRNGTPAEERTVEGASCAAVAEATSVILAIAMIPPGRDAEAKAKAAPERESAASSPDPSASASPAPRASTSEGEGPRASTNEAAEKSAGAPADREAYRRSFAGMAGGATDATTLPAAALGGRIGLAWTPGRARVEIAGSYFSGQSKTTDASQAGARFTLLVAGARGCWALLRGAVELSPCAGADVQVMRAKGFGAAQNYDASGAWLSAAGGALVRVPLGSWFALRADADAIVPLSRPTFVVEGDGAVHRPSSIGARAGIGAELLFL